VNDIVGSSVKDIYRVSNEGYLEFSPGFFQRCMRDYLDEPTLEVVSARYLGEVGVTATTRMKYTGGAEKTGKLLGLFRYEIEYAARGAARTIAVLVKSKTHYRELVHRLATVLVKGGIELSDVAGLLARTELYNTHMKEINVFRMQKVVPALAHVLPAVYGTYVDDESETYIVLEEFLADAYVMRDYRDISWWTRERIAQCVADFAAMHAGYYASTEALVHEGWLGKTMDVSTMSSLAPLWKAYAARLRRSDNELFDTRYLDAHERWIETLPQWWGRIDVLPKTLIYNDAQIRNLAVREPATRPRLVLFDWECASIQLPQRDLVEFLSYAVSERISDVEITDFIEAARAELERRAGRRIDRSSWLEGCRCSIMDLHVNRMACQLVLHVTLNRPDIERVFRASMRILNVLGQS
jgi:hypothetical protein